ncbi:MAG: hypothetical protein KBF23_04345 [Agitococcus sp.]|jgi:hypothetical protein|nr:hypothetical protein [Moraxellaceae bacterium]MBK8327057.1 hypothetical protein [Moraxellaceae bacterium]MBP9216378.1 hypothetical protein [Agitococcus sp.]MCC6373857.1 hypothetical protein [Moraxellaceae bacterium]HQV81398.1 DUF4412 domain-containing protein [Agitococcus sp.]
MNVIPVIKQAIIAACICITSITCTYAQSESFAEYSATQTIETVPGPFVNKIFMTPNKERQDASLGGTVVTTIIRHDKGVAWLLIPSKKEYNEIDITTTAAASVHPTLQGKSNTELGQETLEGAVVKKFALNNEDGQPSTFVWVSESGIILKADIPQNDTTGRPQASIYLKDVVIGTQDSSLFELPDGYIKAQD